MPTRSAAAFSTPSTRSLTRVLVLDDDSFQLDLLSEHLRSLGFLDLTCLTSAAEAMRKISGTPDCAASCCWVRFTSRWSAKLWPR
jgi:PleD family two-component response regulator